MINNDQKYMSLALKLARKAEGSTYPNPLVGAVIVKNDKVLGRGYHKKAGMDHAEVAAIKNASKNIKGSTMYVTLEPCNHYGRTPPCTKAIIDSGIKKVVYAMKDPNPITGGKGHAKLRRAGVEVVAGICKKESQYLNRQYVKFITKKIPYVTVKTAESIDGKIAARDGSSKWITNSESREYVKKLRDKYCAILIGSETLIKDDPTLFSNGKRASRIYRIVLDSTLKTTKKHNLIKTADTAPVVIAVTTKASAKKIKDLNAIDNVEVIVCKSDAGKVDLRDCLKRLAKRNIVNLFVEGGAKVAGAFFDKGLADEYIFFIAPKIIGGEKNAIKGAGAGSINKAVDLEVVEVKRFGNDIMIRGIK